MGNGKASFIPRPRTTETRAANGGAHRWLGRVGPMVALRDATEPPIPLDALGAGRAIAEGRFLLVDTGEALAKFMVAGLPDADLFRNMLARIVAQVTGSSGDGPPGVPVLAKPIDLFQLWG